MGGLSTAIDMYAPEHSNDPQFFEDAANYLQSAGTLDNITQDSVLMKAVDTIIQEAMGFVMIVSSLLLIVVFIVTLRLKNPKRQ